MYSFNASFLTVYNSFFFIYLTDVESTLLILCNEIESLHRLRMTHIKEYTHIHVYIYVDNGYCIGDMLFSVICLTNHKMIIILLIKANRYYSLLIADRHERLFVVRYPSVCNDRNLYKSSFVWGNFPPCIFNLHIYFNNSAKTLVTEFFSSRLKLPI